MTQICSIPNCDKPTIARGWCRNHYWHWSTYGDPLVGKRTDFRTRFWNKVDVMVDGCWLWTAAKQKGYGAIRSEDNSRLLRAHRVAYEFAYGPIADELVLDHLCRNPACVRPDHLEPVTLLENFRRGAPTNADRLRAKTHCAKGHPFEGRNLIIRPTGSRQCRTCGNEAARRYQERRRERSA